MGFLKRDRVVVSQLDEDLSVLSSISLSDLKFTWAAANNWARQPWAASLEEYVPVAQLSLSLLIALVVVADNGLSTDSLHSVPLSVMGTDWSSTSGENSWSHHFFAISLFSFASGASIVLARWESAFDINHLLHGSVFIRAWTGKSSAARNGVLDLIEGWFLPDFLGWGSSSLLDNHLWGSHHHWGRGHHHFETVVIRKIK